MLEIILCSLVTVFPDFLYRRYAQGKRIGKEITVFSVWYELRVGITACIMLAVALIAVIFYHHPSTMYAKPFFRTVPIVPEVAGRVEEIFVQTNAVVEAGAPLFRLDTAKQEAALELARRKVAEVEAAIVTARAEVEAAHGQLLQARGAYEQAVDEINTRKQLRDRNSGIVAQRDIERLQKTVDMRLGALRAAEGNKLAAETRVTMALPAQKASADAALGQAQVDLDRMTVRAGVAGQLQQFVLRKGDFLNAFMRPAGVLIPTGAGRAQVHAGFDQIEAQVMKVGMIAEITCVSLPMTIIPMVVTNVQGYIASGQVRAADQLVDAQQFAAPGTLTVTMEPLYDGGLEGVTPGSNCIANAYSNNHDRLGSKDIGTLRWIYLHVVDTVSIVHAILLRVQAVILPIKTLVLSGHG